MPNICPVFIPTQDLAQKLIAEQFPEYAHFQVTEVEKQGHDNRTYRLGDNMLIRMPTAAEYALKVPKEQALLPQLARYFSVSIPAPIKMGEPSEHYPYPFSIYQWLPGKSVNLLTLNEKEMAQLAVDVATFLKTFQAIQEIPGPPPGQHNWWRGDHVHVYEADFHEQLSQLRGEINTDSALTLWEKACQTQWEGPPVWVHGDMAIGNLLMERGKLSAVIDFGGMAMGDPACDLVIAWTYFKEKARHIFIAEMAIDTDTWLRARAWALWKATFELCQLKSQDSDEAKWQKRIIADIIDG